MFVRTENGKNVSIQGAKCPDSASYLSTCLKLGIWLSSLLNLAKNKHGDVSVSRLWRNITMLASEGN